MFELFPGYNETPMIELAMQLPSWTHGTPYAIDWNNDNVLDLWHHNHFEFSKVERRWSTAGIGKKGNAPGGCLADWDAVLRNGDTSKYSSPNNGNGFIEWTDDIKIFGESCIDAHSTAFLDIDNDGFKDLFIITGGGRGIGNSSNLDNMLFWGVSDTSSTLGYRLVGGVQAAQAAGLNGRRKSGNERGRHQYWFDADGDGLLDVAFLSTEREDTAVSPGHLYHNMGDRTFKIAKPRPKGVAIFASTALLTDVDGDSFAHELVVVSECGPPMNRPCRRSPRGSINVYRRTATESLLVLAATSPASFPNDKEAKTLYTADFDKDGRSDVAILYRESVGFHLSSVRQQKCRTEEFPKGPKRRKCFLTLGAPDKVLRVDNCGESGAVGMRFADFTLVGSLQMLVLCKDIGKHVIFEQLSDGNWREILDNGKRMNYGDLESRDLMLGGPDFCKGVPLISGVPSPNNETCSKIFNEEACKTVRYPKQFLICSQRAQSPNGRVAYTLGATVADIDNDGFVDLIVSHKFGSSVILRNDFGKQGPKRFFAVRLDRTAGAAPSIGAIVKLTASRMGPGENETTTQMRVLSSLSHEADELGGHEDRLIFGLGKRGDVKKLVVIWPNCCRKTVVLAREVQLSNWYNSMDNPYELPAPTNCDKKCYKI